MRRFSRLGAAKRQLHFGAGLAYWNLCVFEAGAALKAAALYSNLELAGGEPVDEVAVGGQEV
jgi:hypothetical protein